MNRPTWLHDLSEADYHSDILGGEPTLNQSTANTILNRSPYHAWLEHPKLGNKRRKATKVMDRGTVVHSILLGNRADIVVLDYDNYRTKAAQEARDRAAEQGETPVLRKDYEYWLKDAEKIKAELAGDFGIHFEGISEACIYWQDHAPNGEQVECRSMLDHLEIFNGHAHIYDLKTTTNASPGHVTKSIINYGYDVQAAAYIRAVTESDPSLAGRIDYTIVFIEDSPAQAITPVKLSEGFLTVGRQKWDRALHIWEQCLRRNSWPCYADSTITLQPPDWYVAQAEFVPSNWEGDEDA